MEFAVRCLSIAVLLAVGICIVLVLAERNGLKFKYQNEAYKYALITAVILMLSFLLTKAVWGYSFLF
jgi:hypothetical protein